MIAVDLSSTKATDRKEAATERADLVDQEVCAVVTDEEIAQAVSQG
ncbi:hypothetical protein ACFL3S_06035 [Gemmatimonadota bacterium]